MIRRLQIIAICLLVARDPAAGQAQTLPTARCKGTITRDTLHPTWIALRKQYGALARAIRAKNLDAMFALYTDDFQVATNTGERWTRERSLEYQRNGMVRVDTTTHISNTILELIDCGQQATATVLQVWHRKQQMAGAWRLVQTNAVQDEMWTLTPRGWLRGNISDVRNGVALVDGKRVDVTKPYDPDAPEFDPDGKASPSP